MPSRRQFIAGSAAGLGLAAVPAVTYPVLARRTASGFTDLTKFADPLPIPPVLQPDSTLTIRQRAAKVRLHSQLPLTPVWTYEGSFPGPVIDVRRGQRLRVTWLNRIEGAFPLTAVTVPFTGLDSILSPGRGGAQPLAEVSTLPAWVVTHLHGGVTGGDNDGWPENGIPFGAGQLAEYPNDQRAATLWYHDHAMDITAYNVMTGLVGMYLVRDAEEDALSLPSGPLEIPLVLCDRNLDTDDAGKPNGRLLHKVGYVNAGPHGDQQVNLPFAGPYNLVNGVIWPYLTVTPRWYRFRVLNAANARTYTLELQQENADGTTSPVPGALVQIGTEQGLLGAPVRHDRLTLAPAERADLLVDFSAFRGGRLRLIDAGGGPTAPLGPEIMQFRVGGTSVTDSFSLPAKPSPSFVRLDATKIPADHVIRYVAVATDDGTASGHPELWELAQTADDYTPVPGDRIVQIVKNGTTATFRRVASSFEEGPTFFVELDGWEVWNFIHLVGPNHPSHIHLLSFQALGRDTYTVTVRNDTAGDVVTYVATFDRTKGLGPDEQGWKDTIRIDEHDLVSVAGQFSGGSGRYVYHCHILEHEDEGMMRPFVVAPKQVLALMEHGGHHHH
ncbi:multicopper oxidase domain-containing protein [Microbispora sp. NBRC 16548]|uniref:multicopper oxidase family protein n=1 Tax=Microbispora sp. NBRC 16548 TaxID=3030994 RepID=UPI0024A5BA44|nr:multicopper oxidase domain-containing protein [Microbispora sp. NBRC 16548]GLX10964.1 multicopper oxidase [Microbispora sp. NBRC 16548]